MDDEPATTANLGPDEEDRQADSVEFEITNLGMHARLPSWWGRHVRTPEDAGGPEATRFFPRWPLWLRRGARAGLVSVIVLCALAGAAPRTHQLAILGGNPATLLPASLGYGCVRDLAWDPLQPRLALLLSCHQAGIGRAGRAGSGVLVVWDLHGRDQQGSQGQYGARRIVLDPLAGTSRAAPPAYQGLAWSGDGTQLAVTFAAGSHSGLLLLSPDGTLLRRWLAPRPSPARPPAQAPAQQGGASVLRWDVSQGALRTVWLRLAESYSWAHDELVAASAAVAERDHAAVPVGEPAGGASFAMWQPGLLVRVTGDAGPARWTPFPFTAWSPDQRTLVTPLYSSVVLEHARAGTGSGLTPSSSPALQQAVQSPGTRFVAWQPDGALLASYAGGDSRVLLRDRWTGEIVLALRPRTLTTAGPIGAVSDAVLAWSPDGSRLALLDAVRGTIDVWTLRPHR